MDQFERYKLATLVIFMKPCNERIMDDGSFLSLFQTRFTTRRINMSAAGSRLIYAPNARKVAKNITVQSSPPRLPSPTGEP